MTQDTHTYDVAIVGGGPGGAATAGLLARLGLDVVVFQSEAGSRPSVGEFLSPQARAVAHRLALLDADWEARHRSAPAFHTLWGSDTLVTRQCIWDARGPALLLNRGVFEGQLAAGAKRAGARFECSSRVVHAKRRREVWSIMIESHKRPIRQRALFLIDCSGRVGQPIAGLPSVRRRVDRLVCLGVRLKNYQGDGTPAIESYCRGWTYSAGIGQEELIVNLCTEKTPHRGGIRRAFLRELAECRIAVSRVHSTSLKHASDVSFFFTDCGSSLTRPAAGTAWCLAGDRAQSFDPLCSAGIECALKHAQFIADAARSVRAVRELDLTAYGIWLDNMYSQYLNDRRTHYNREKRWHAPFWQTRAGDPLNVREHSAG